MARPTASDLLRIVRAPFLLLTPLSVAVGAAAAWLEFGTLAPGRLAVILLGAVAAHASVNALNEYQDFRSGLDLHTRRTPFSGGSGALPEKPALAPLALALAWLLGAVTVLCGLYLLRVSGPALLPLGLLGLALVAFYTRHINRLPWLCLIAPGLGFGPVMVLGTSYALTGHFTDTALFAALPVFFLVNGLLLLNQFPDVEADAAAGRRHLPIVLGRRRAARVFGLLLVLAYGSAAAGVALGALPPTALLVLATAPLALSVWRGARRRADEPPALVPVLGRNVALTLATPLLLTLGLAAGNLS